MAYDRHHWHAKAEFLSLLEYPYVDSMNLSWKGELVQLVSWLEDRKIRALDLGERENLRKYKSGWDSVFASYLTEIECPFEWPKQSDDCINWLVSHAINIEYEDVAKDCYDLEDRHKTTTEEMNVDQDIDNTYVDISDHVDKIGHLISFPRLCDEDDIEYLCRIKRHIHLYYSVSAQKSIQLYTTSTTTSSSTDINNKSSTISSSGHDTMDTSGNSSGIGNTSGSSSDDRIQSSLKDFPLGFTTEDGTLDEIIKVLKMVHLDDFKELQSDLNALISLGQEYTANPRTNTALGKVGR